MTVVRRMHLAHPEVAKIILLDTYDREVVVNAFRSGARGLFCFSQYPFRLLCKCIQSVHQGQVWANSEQMQYLIEALSQVPSLHMVNSRGIRLLTPREEQVVALVADGLSNREVARELCLSEHTIKKYLFRIFDKLGISSRVELVLYALSHGGSRQAEWVAGIRRLTGCRIVRRRPSPGLRHLLADDDGMPGLGVDPRSHRQTTAGYRICVLPLGHNAMLDDLRGGRRHLAAHWRRISRGCQRIAPLRAARNPECPLFRARPGQAHDERNEGRRPRGQPGGPHPPSARLALARIHRRRKLDAELERVFDICHGCRRCFSLCNSFPTLFDAVDATPTGELDGVDKEAYW